jgi:2-methylcitrate dehydratase
LAALRRQTTKIGWRGMRASMHCAHSCRCARTPAFTADYYAPDKRYIGNALQVFFRDGSATRRIQIDVPIGHRRRRAEGRPLLIRKFETSVAAHFPPKQAALIQNLFANPVKLDATSVNEFMSTLVTNS